MSNEAICVVPLHQPKPTLTIAERSRRRKTTDDFELHPRRATPGARLVYTGGPLLTKVEVFVIYWGASWQDTATGRDLKSKLDKFFTDILVSPLMTQLAEYNVPGKKIGQGIFTGSVVVTAKAPTGSVSDVAIRTNLKSWLKQKFVPPTNPNALTFVYTEPGIAVVMGGAKSCSSFCGYHNDINGKIFYAVMPYPSCAGCLGGMTSFDALTATSSHELCEAITDAVPGAGWYDSTQGEIGDICAWNFKKVGGYTVQLEWSNLQNKCV